MRIRVPVARHGSSTAKFIVAAFTTMLLAGCSDSIERFSQNYKNPSDSDPVYTASVPKYKTAAPLKYAKPRALASNNDEAIVQSPIASTPVYRAKPTYDYTQAYKKPQLAYQPPAAPVYKQPTVALSTPTYKAPVYKPQSYQAPVYKQPSFNADQQVAQDETPVAQPAPIYKKPVQMAEAPIAKSSATVRVGSGMTLYSIAKANGLSVQQLAAANGISSPYTVSSGRVLRIPGAQSAQLPTRHKPVSLVQEEQQAAAAPIKLKAKGAHTVISGDTLYSLGRQYGVSPFAIADLNGLSHNKALSVGQQLRVPGGAFAKASPVQQEQVADNSDDTQIAPKSNAPLAMPKAQPIDKQVAEIPAPATGALAMRWPVKGKVISDFGTKPNGMKNEGINISVPEGTSIRAAEGGVVAYAGNELKGYGNLVLIRHEGGFVTAYAHAKALNVKRGDTVKRGDVIAISGQTGAVQSPQLHFEVRKGASALNPNKYLNSSTAMN